MLTLDPHTGISISGGFNHCICLEGNTFYDKARAEKDALSFFVDPHACNYETACLLQDLGTLLDARLEEPQGSGVWSAVPSR